MAEDVEIDNVGLNNDKMVKKLLFTSKNLNRAVKYLIPKVRLAFT